MATMKPAKLPPADQLALYAKLIEFFPEVERKGRSMPFTAVKGNMFSFLDAEGVMGLRLPPAARAEFLKKYSTELVIAHGIVLKEYVKVPVVLLHKTAELKKYFAESWAYAQTLKPKATTRARKTASLRKS